VIIAVITAAKAALSLAVAVDGIFYQHIGAITRISRLEKSLRMKGVVRYEHFAQQRGRLRIAARELRKPRSALLRWYFERFVQKLGKLAVLRLAQILLKHLGNPRLVDSRCSRRLDPLIGTCARNDWRGLSPRIPPIVRLRDIGCRPLGVTILAVVKTVFGGSWNTERRTKTIALYIGAAAKWTRIKFHITHVLDSVILANATAGENIERFPAIAGWFSTNLRTSSV
jgi:hypothetical protein